MPFRALSARRVSRAHLFPENVLSYDARLRPGRERRAESVRYEKWGKKADVVLRGREANPARHIRW